MKEIKNNSDKEDRLLIKSIKRDKCSPCISAIKEKHIGLVLSIYSRYGKSLSNLHFYQEDFNQEIDYIIFNSIKRFDLRYKKIKFSTWLGEQVKFFCLNKITELNKLKTISAEPETITKIIDDCFNSNNTKENDELCQYIFHLLEQIKDERILKIFKMRYFDGAKKMTWTEIGEALIPPITNQTCLNLHNKTIKFLRKKVLSKISSDAI